MTSQLYFSVKTKDSVTVRKILNKESNIEMSGLNILENALKIGQLVFVVLGGDKPEWDTGLIGLGVISKEPYDKGYDNSNKRNYKINIDMKIILQKAIKQNSMREGRAFVPETAIRNMFSNFSIPAFEEGFDNIYIYRQNKNKVIYEILRKG